MRTPAGQVRTESDQGNQEHCGRRKKPEGRVRDGRREGKTHTCKHKTNTPAALFSKVTHPAADVHPCRPALSGHCSTSQSYSTQSYDEIKHCLALLLRPVINEVKCTLCTEPLHSNTQPAADQHTMQQMCLFVCVPALLLWLTIIF